MRGTASKAAASKPARAARPAAATRAPAKATTAKASSTSRTGTAKSAPVRSSRPAPAKAAAPKATATRKPAATPAPKATSRTAAKPAAPRPKRVKLTPPQIDRLVQVTVESLEADKAEDIVVLDVATRATFADRMVIATGLVERQIQAMAGHIEKALAELGMKRLRSESSPDWVLLDAGDLVVHLFKPEARANYRLEKMWGPDSPLDAESPAAAESTRPTPSDFDEEDEAYEEEDVIEEAAADPYLDDEEEQG
ncbi:ribosome silencing factor [Roseomonas marmotae]|uniref:Ribosomal silencing factor RsfS n=2 Tax=Roseomonas marmotae TaxID=2768161 RepID=A0ABS3K6W8_9PROT|nr:ribosome silencing factor [Roseomonas marmotae]QTI81039.1 ribosome silencing factor [Roseomonas marmotae]